MGAGVFSGLNPETFWVPEQNARGQLGWQGAGMAGQRMTEAAWELGPQFSVSNSRFLS